MFTTAEYLENEINGALFEMENIAKRMLSDLQSQAKLVEKYLNQVENITSPQERANRLQSISEVYRHAVSDHIVVDMQRIFEKVYTLNSVKMVMWAETETAKRQVAD